MCITVFKANDGKWQYAPQTLRHWPILEAAGRFETKAEAVAAAEDEHGDATIRIEAGIFGLFG
jgi:alkylhydroperoxidase family enzyme